MFFKLFFINLFIIALMSIITGFLRIILNISFKEVNQQISIIWLLNLSMIPVLEEIAYRLPLIYSKRYLALSFMAITYFISSILFADGILDTSANIYIRIIIALGIGGGSYSLLTIRSIENKISEIWTKHFKIVFYTLLCLFTIGHLGSYDISLAVLILFPILISPQFIGGVFLSFIRTKFGFGYSILFHVLINIFAFSPQIIMYLIY